MYVYIILREGRRPRDDALRSRAWTGSAIRTGKRTAGPPYRNNKNKM